MRRNSRSLVPPPRNRYQPSRPSVMPPTFTSHSIHRSDQIRNVSDNGNHVASPVMVLSSYDPVHAIHQCIMCYLFLSANVIHAPCFLLHYSKRRAIMHYTALVIAVAFAVGKWLRAAEAAKDNGGPDAFPFSYTCFTQWPSTTVSN